MAHVAIFTCVRVEARDEDAGLGQTVVACERRVERVEHLVEQLARDGLGKPGDRQVSGGEGHLHRVRAGVRREHHDDAPDAAEILEELGVACEGHTGLDDDAFLNGRRDDGAPFACGGSFMSCAQDVEHVGRVAGVKPAGFGRRPKLHVTAGDVRGQGPGDAEAAGLGFKQRAVADQEDRVGHGGCGLERDFRSNAGGLAGRDGNGPEFSHGSPQ